MHNILIVIIVIFVSVTVQAQTAELQKSPVSRPFAADDTRIVSDQKAGVIRFIVKGKEQAYLDESGLHVRNDIQYGGVMADTSYAPRTGTDK